jgi:hypothetical protein
VPTTKLKDATKRIETTKMVLCTLASLSNESVEKYVMFSHVPLRNLVVDEASQIDMTSEFMVLCRPWVSCLDSLIFLQHLFFRHRNTLKNVCWFGDPKQCTLP